MPKRECERECEQLKFDCNLYIFKYFIDAYKKRIFVVVK